MKTSLVVITLLFCLSQAAQALTFNIEYIGESKPADVERIEKIKLRIEEVVKTDAFKDLVVRYNNYSCYNSKNLPSGVSSTQDILNHIEKAIASIKVAFYQTSPDILGSTIGKTISFNTNNFITRTDASVGNTLLHETLHTLGYGHCGKNNINLFPKIKRSVPYKLGDFAEKLY